MREGLRNLFFIGLSVFRITSFLASCNFCRLLITFANSLDPDKDRQNNGPDLDPKRFDTLIVFLKEFFEKVNFEKSQQTTTKA